MELRDYYCMSCDWEAKQTKKLLDGINCPNCNGYSVMKRKPEQVTDREYYVRDKIMELNLEHCRSLTPEQVKTVLSIGDEYKSKQIKHTVQPLQPLLHDVLLHEGEEVTPLLSIVLDDINSTPTVHYKGEEITYRRRIVLDWETADEHGPKPTYLHIEHHDLDSKGINSKIIQHNHSRIGEYSVRDQIMEINEYCGVLTPEKVRTILRIGDGSAIPSADKKESNIQGAAKDKVIELLTDYDVAYIDYDAKEDTYSIRLDKDTVVLAEDGDSSVIPLR